MINERRDDTRLYPSAPFWVYDRDTHKPIGRLEDFCSNGIRLSSDRPIPPETVLSCKMAVPKEVSKSGAITFDARSLWTKKESESDRYQSGFELLNVVRAEIERLKGVTAKPALKQ